MWADSLECSRGVGDEGDSVIIIFLKSRITMPFLFRDLPGAAQAAYSNAATAIRTLEARRDAGMLPGNFVTKTVKGEPYWYFQYTDLSGKQRQVYVGRDDEATRRLRETHINSPNRDGLEHARRLARAAIDLGCASLIPAHSRVIAKLADASFFRVGGVLIGTHAYAAYQNPLGIRWDTADSTTDLDFAHDQRLSTAIASDVHVDVASAIESLQMGFVPLKSLSTYQKADEPDFQIDFLTSMGRTGEEAVHNTSLNLRLQPLRFMEFSLEDPFQSVVLGSVGPIVVNLPRPEKYALHKLLVAPERTADFKDKVRKDLTQAASLVAYLTANDPDALGAAIDNLHARGSGWTKRFKAGLTMLRAMDLASTLDFSIVNG
jgi:hypothetical protein